MSKTQKKTFKDTKFYKEIQALRREMKDMTWKQKIEHIWTYYKEYIIVGGVFLIITGGLIGSMLTRVDPLVTGIFVNLNVDQKGMNYVSTDYAEHIGVGKKEIKVESAYFEDPDMVFTDENYYAMAIVENEVSAQMLDYLIMDQMAMDHYAGREIYMDLRKVLPLEELQALAEQDLIEFCVESEYANLTEEEEMALQVLCLTEEGAGIEYFWPSAIKITNLDFIKDFVTKDGDIYFAFASNTEKIEATRAIWEYINAYKSKAK